MKIYLAANRWGSLADGVGLTTKEKLSIGRVKRRLFSYYYYGNKLTPSYIKDLEWSVELGIELFLDSGAFTAFTKNETISCKSYADYLKTTKWPWQYKSSVDFIGEGWEAAEKSYQNLKELEDLGVKVQPVWHVREPDEWLKFYIDAGYDYIFIGGMVPETTEWLRERLDHVFGTILVDLNSHKPLVKLHGFGLTDTKLMFRYPWYSVDSSSWLAAGVYGKCMYPKGNGELFPIQFSTQGEARKVNGNSYKLLPESFRTQVDAWLATFRFTAKQCEEHYTYRDAVNAAVYQELEKFGVDKFELQQDTLFGGE